MKDDIHATSFIRDQIKKESSLKEHLAHCDFKNLKVKRLEKPKT